jgi:hypothetical protein
MSDFQALFLASLVIGVLIKAGELVGEIIVAIIKGAFSIIKRYVYLAFLKLKNKRRGI